MKATLLYSTNLELEGNSALFRSINQNKQSYAADLKDPADLERIKKLIAKAEIFIQYFRPGIIECKKVSGSQKFRPGV